MNKMQVNFKHFVWYQQFGLFIYYLHTVILETQFGRATEFCFTVFSLGFWCELVVPNCCSQFEPGCFNTLRLL